MQHDHTNEYVDFPVWRASNLVNRATLAEIIRATGVAAKIDWSRVEAAGVLAGEELRAHVRVEIEEIREAAERP